VGGKKEYFEEMENTVILNAGSWIKYFCVLLTRVLGALTKRDPGLGSRLS
jgi:hypothetical protein